MRMRRVTWPGGRGHPKPHIWNQRPKFAYSLHNFYGATTTIKGSLPDRKRFQAENFLKSRQNLAPNGGFRELWGVNVKFLFSNPEKAHPCAEPRCLTYYAWKSVQGPRRSKKPEKSRVNILKRNFAHTRKETPWGIMTKLRMWVDIQDIIT